MAEVRLTLDQLILIGVFQCLDLICIGCTPWVITGHTAMRNIFKLNTISDIKNRVYIIQNYCIVFIS